MPWPATEPSLPDKFLKGGLSCTKERKRGVPMKKGKFRTLTCMTKKPLLRRKVSLTIYILEERGHISIKKELYDPSTHKKKKREDLFFCVLCEERRDLLGRKNGAVPSWSGNRSYRRWKKCRTIFAGPLAGMRKWLLSGRGGTTYKVDSESGQNPKAPIC